jgi:hypothetical protein
VQISQHYVHCIINLCSFSWSEIGKLNISITANANKRVSTLHFFFNLKNDWYLLLLIVLPENTSSDIIHEIEWSTNDLTLVTK